MYLMDSLVHTPCMQTQSLARTEYDTETIFWRSPERVTKTLPYWKCDTHSARSFSQRALQHVVSFRSNLDAGPLPDSLRSCADVSFV